MICRRCSTSNPEFAASCSNCGEDFLEDAPTAAKDSRQLGEWQRDSRQSQTLSAGFEIGRRYRVVSLLGRGGMGAVYRVHDNELDRDVALKLIRPELDDPSLMMERFKREIQLSSVVTHRNVLRVYDLGESDGVKFLTMQLVEGEDLALLIHREAPLPIERAVSIFRQICEGLAAAHEQDVLHRDIKPQNVMIGPGDHVYLTDFGLARTSEDGGLTATGAVIGTPHYMSPEQVKGQSLDARSDIYSLGVLFFQLVTGSLPFPGHSGYEAMIERVQHNAPKVSGVNPRVPPEVAHVVDRCLAKNPERRYQSVQEILAELGGSTAAAPRAPKRLSAVAALLAFLLLGGAMAWMFLRTRDVAPATAAEKKPVTVLIADLNNLSGDPIFDETLEPVLTIGLEAAPFVTAYNRATARKTAQELKPGVESLDPALARLVALREGVQVVIAGALERTNGGFELTSTAVDTATGKSLGTATEVAQDREAVLRVAGKVAEKLRIVLGDAPDEKLAQETFTAASLEAAREYAAGQQLQWAGRYDEAIKRYEAAVKLDPTMGRAYAGMAAMYSNLGEREQAEHYYRLAMQHIDRMMDREKYRTRGGYYLLMRNQEKALEEFSELARQYPADTAALSNLALAYFYRRDMTRAMEEGKRPLEIYPKNVLYRNNLALYAMYAGDFSTAAREASSVLEMNDEFVKAYVALALSFIGTDKLDEAEATYKRLQPVGERGASFAASGLADLAMLRGDHQNAADTLRPAIAADEKAGNRSGASRKRVMLAEALLAGGNVAEAVREAKLATEASDSENVLYPAARVLAQSGARDEAAKIAVALASRLEGEPQLYAKLLRGETLLLEKKPREALTVLTESQQAADTWMGRYLRGRAYNDLEAFTEAYSDLETATKRKGEAVAVLLDEIPTARLLAPLYYELGRAQQGLGSPAARASFEKFKAGSAP